MSDREDDWIPRRPRRKVTLGLAPPAVRSTRKPHAPSHGVGAQADIRYCRCGAKKNKGLCVRGCQA